MKEIFGFPTLTMTIKQIQTIERERWKTGTLNDFACLDGLKGKNHQNHISYLQLGTKIEESQKILTGITKIVRK